MILYFDPQKRRKKRKRKLLSCVLLTLVETPMPCFFQWLLESYPRYVGVKWQGKFLCSPTSIDHIYIFDAIKLVFH